MTAADAAGKAALRVRAKALRATFDSGLGAALAGHVLRALPLDAGAVVAGYWPIGSEIDVRPLLLALAARGHALALPETTPAGQALVFRRWAPGEALVEGRFGTRHPAGAAVTPDVVLVPLLAFDDAGRRLGYGGGYYDRTLAGLTGAFRLGCGFAGQAVAAVPAEAHDLPLHAVATEAGVKRF